MRAFFLAVTIGCACLFADSANVRVVEERHFPEGWSQPETATQDGATSVRPSVPEDLQKRQTGSVLDIDAATVHAGGKKDGSNAVSVPVTYTYKLRLPGNRVVKLKPGQWVSTGEDTVRLLKGPDGVFFLEYRETGRVLCLRRGS